MTNKKTFVIQIDGIEKAYNDLTLLSETLDKIDTQIAKPKTLNLIASAFKDTQSLFGEVDQDIENKMIAIKNMQKMILETNNILKGEQSKSDEKETSSKNDSFFKKLGNSIGKGIEWLAGNSTELTEIFNELTKVLTADSENKAEGAKDAAETEKSNSFWGKMANITDWLDKKLSNLINVLDGIKNVSSSEKKEETSTKNDDKSKADTTDSQAQPQSNKALIRTDSEPDKKEDSPQTDSPKNSNTAEESPSQTELKQETAKPETPKIEYTEEVNALKKKIEEEEKLLRKHNDVILTLEQSAIAKKYDIQSNSYKINQEETKANLEKIKGLRQEDIDNSIAGADRIAQIYDEMSSAYEENSIEHATITYEKQQKITEIYAQIISDQNAALNNNKAFYEAYKKDLEESNEEIVNTVKKRTERISELEKIAAERDTNTILGVNRFKKKETKQNYEDLINIRKQNISDLKEEAKKTIDIYNDISANIVKGSEEEAIILDAKKKLMHSINEQIKSEEAAVNSLRKQYQADYQTYLDDIAKQITEKYKEYEKVYDAAKEVVKGFLDLEIESLNEDLKQTEQRIAEKTQAYTTHSSKVEELQAEVASASGQQSAALQEQLAREMAARDEALQQQKEQEKEKEEIEKKIARKKKQQAKIDKVQEIAKATADQSAAIIKAWGAGPILGPIMAGITAAATAIQLAKLIKSWDKLEDGGLLNGKRHTQGGMRIEGTNIEVEGDEFVVNRISTRKNLGLIDYINRNRKELTPQDLDNYFVKSGKSPQSSPTLATQRMYEEGGRLTNLDVINTAAAPDNDKILEAIAQINFKPVVSVVDIANVQQSITDVKDIAGL